MGYSIFLSHSSVDSPWVKWIDENARGIGIGVYLFEHDPKPGKPIAEKVKSAILACDSLMVLLTDKSQFSSYVQQEIGFAEANRKLIIPLVQPGVPQRSLAMLEGREYVSFDFRNPKQALLTILPYLQKLKKTKENQQVVLLGLGAIIVAALLLGGEN